jgi:branched-chain amino acid transport system ATP-binding protein
MGLLGLAGLRKRFGAVVIASGIDLDVRAGEAVGILGPNGAGKTSLFGMITGTLRPDGGQVFFEGVDVTALPPEARCRRGMARSFQVPQPFGDMSVFENLLVGAVFGDQRREHHVYENCLEILEKCGLADKANQPAGALRLLDRKRLELARALATNPKLLLLDEVAGGLTEHECHALIALIREVHASGVTIIWIEHVVHALLATVSRTLVLYGGQFIADGKPDEVIRDPQVVEIYMGIDADG